MSQAYSASKEGNSLLFACTRCNSRHPFEELSRRHQLCRACRATFKVINCDFCRTEFKLELSDEKASSICKKCLQLQEQHGKPMSCACCTIQAAFIGTRCQRCTNSEKKYGPPLTCDNCRQKSAFDRPDPESKEKVGGKILCWLCTMDYKRSQAKSKHKEQQLLGSSSHNRSRHRSSKTLDSSNHHHQHHKSDKTNGHRISNSASTNNSTTLGSSATNVASSSYSHHRQSSSHRDGSSPKKARVDRPGASNGLSSITESRFLNQANSESTAIVTQLKEQISMLNKKLLIKEKELQTKDQQIADLKSTQTREQREMREKMTSIQRQHDERISEMQSKLIAMQRQIAAQAKASRANNSTSGYVEPPLVI